MVRVTYFNSGSRPLIKSGPVEEYAIAEPNPTSDRLKSFFLEDWPRASYGPAPTARIGSRANCVALTVPMLDANVLIKAQRRRLLSCNWRSYHQGAQYFGAETDTPAKNISVLPKRADVRCTIWRRSGGSSRDYPSATPSSMRALRQSRSTVRSVTPSSPAISFSVSPPK